MTILEHQKDTTKLITHKIYLELRLLRGNQVEPKQADVFCFIHTVMLKASAQNFRTTIGLCISQQIVTWCILTRI